MEEVGARHVGLIVADPDDVSILDRYTTQHHRIHRVSCDTCCRAAKRATCVGLESPAQGGIVPKFPIEIASSARDTNLQHTCPKRAWVHSATEKQRGSDAVRTTTVSRRGGSDRARSTWKLPSASLFTLNSK